MTTVSIVLFGEFKDSLTGGKSCNRETKPRVRLQKIFWLQFGKGNYTISGEHNLQIETSEEKQAIF